MRTSKLPHVRGKVTDEMQCLNAKHCTIVLYSEMLNLGVYAAPQLLVLSIGDVFVKKRCPLCDGCKAVDRRSGICL